MSKLNCKRPGRFVAASCWDAIVKKGWHPQRRGFPTFMAFSDDGQVVFIEDHVKRSPSARQNQVQLFTALTQAGFQCLTWDHKTKSFSVYSP